MMKIGFVTISNQIMLDKRPVGYLYREDPCEKDDSGWRVFSGFEDEIYAENAENFALYNASTLVDLDPALAPILGKDYPVAFEKDQKSGKYVEVKE